MFALVLNFLSLSLIFLPPTGTGLIGFFVILSASLNCFVLMFIFPLVHLSASLFC